MNSSERSITKKLFKSLDKQFDDGWKAFVDENRKNNDISNHRLLKLLLKIKDEDFVSDLVSLMMLTDSEHAHLNISRKPKGIEVPDNRLPIIKTIWIDQRQTRAYENATHEGYIYVQVKKDRWIKFHFLS